MHDKQIRRRRAVLALLVIVSLILLTAYFGESPNSPLHSLQRGVATVFSPIQDGASRVLSPVRDVAGWFSRTVNAESQNKGLRNQVASLTEQLDQLKLQQQQQKQANGIAKVDTADSLQSYSPLSASVIEKDPSLWYDTIQVNKGTADGVRLNDPVIGSGGLVGDVTEVGPGYAWVSLITSPKFGAGAMVFDGSGDAGILQPAVGNPGTLILGDLPSHANINFGQQVVTSGFADSHDALIKSHFPAGIPIGTVSNQDTQDTLANSQEVDVTPSVDLAHLSVVQILVKPQAKTESASIG